MRLLVVNVNTTVAMTEFIVASARSVAAGHIASLIGHRYSSCRSGPPAWSRRGANR